MSGIPCQAFRHLESFNETRGLLAPIELLRLIASDLTPAAPCVSPDQKTGVRSASLLHARVELTDWHHEYNHLRRHSSLGYQAPTEYAETCTCTKPD